MVSETGLPEEQMHTERIVLSISRALNAANEKVIEVGFQLNDFSVSISEENGLWKISYGPKNKNMLGGGIDVYVSKENGKVQRAERTQ